MFKWFGKNTNKEMDTDEAVNPFPVPRFNPSTLKSFVTMAEPHNVIGDLTSMVYKEQWPSIATNIKLINYCANRYDHETNRLFGSSLIIETMGDCVYRLSPDASRYVGGLTARLLGGVSDDISLLKTSLDEYNDILAVIEDITSIPIEEFTHGTFKYWSLAEVMANYNISANKILSPIFKFTTYPTLEFV